MDRVDMLAWIIPLVVSIIGITVALRSRKKNAPQKVEELVHHLQEIGVKPTTEKGMVEGVVVEMEGGDGSWLSRGWKEMWGWISGTKGRVDGVIRIGERHIDYVIVSSVAGQYSVNYFLDYLVRSPGWSGENGRKNTKMVRKKRTAIRGRVGDIEWKGDNQLSQQLNLDQRLMDILLQTNIEGDIEIFPGPQYARVRTAYFLPSPDLLKAIDLIAKHMKSWR